MRDDILLELQHFNQRLLSVHTVQKLQHLSVSGMLIYLFIYLYFVNNKLHRCNMERLAVYIVQTLKTFNLVLHLQKSHVVEILLLN